VSLTCLVLLSEFGALLGYIPKPCFKKKGRGRDPVSFFCMWIAGFPSALSPLHVLGIFVKIQLAEGQQSTCLAVQGLQFDLLHCLKKKKSVSCMYMA
jgi:hypothetical protein